VFHVSFLKKFQGDPPSVPPALPPMVRGRIVPVPNNIVRTRPTTSSWELLVRWQGRGAAETSRVTLEQSKEDFSDFQLKDCFTSQGEVLWTPLGPNILGRLKSPLKIESM
jgi:hypothetical protein